MNPRSIGAVRPAAHLWAEALRWAQAQSVLRPQSPADAVALRATGREPPLLQWNRVVISRSGWRALDSGGQLRKFPKVQKKKIRLSSKVGPSMGSI